MKNSALRRLFEDVVGYVNAIETHGSELQDGFFLPGARMDILETHNRLRRNDPVYAAAYQRFKDADRVMEKSAHGKVAGIFTGGSDLRLVFGVAALSVLHAPSVIKSRLAVNRMFSIYEASSAKPV